jgi:LPXTG-site transpeptidase (sortase) family protein
MINKAKAKEVISEKSIIEIEIPKIDLKGKIYDKNSKLNNIDKNIIIMNDSDMPSDKNGIVIIGGHSGIGKYAYFKDLNKLKIKDLINIYYKNKKYTYEVVNYYLDKKDGSIRISNYNDVNKLIIYTCNPNDKNNYLVIECNLKNKQ